MKLKLANNWADLVWTVFAVAYIAALIWEIYATRINMSAYFWYYLTKIIHAINYRIGRMAIHTECLYFSSVGGN